MTTTAAGPAPEAIRDIDKHLQEIATTASREAVNASGAEGVDHKSLKLISISAAAEELRRLKEADQIPDDYFEQRQLETYAEKADKVVTDTGKKLYSQYTDRQLPLSLSFFEECIFPMGDGRRKALKYFGAPDFTTIITLLHRKLDEHRVATEKTVASLASQSQDVVKSGLLAGAAWLAGKLK